MNWPILEVFFMQRRIAKFPGQKVGYTESMFVAVTVKTSSATQLFLVSSRRSVAGPH